MDEQKMKWHDNIENDPYERYRNAPDGCRDELLVSGFAVLLAVIIIICSSCKTQQPVVTQKDSVRVEYKHDSVYFFQHDSIFRDRWRNGDTIFVTLEKWQTRWRDKVTEVHDTIRTNEVQVQQVKYVPNYYRNTSAGFWVLLVILLAVIGFKAYKLYIKIKTGGIL